MNTAALRRLTGVIVLVVVLGGLHLAGQILATPPLSPGRWLTWWASIDPVLAGASTIRVVATGLCLWLLSVTLVDSLAMAARAGNVQRVTTALVPATWRALVLKPAMVAAVAVPQVILPVAAMSPASGQVIEVVEDADPGPNADGVVAIPIITMSRGAGTSESTATSPTPPTITMRRHVPAEPLVIELESRRHVVQPGENLWSIATDHLATERGERPNSTEVTPYWHALIEANRSVLPDPDNPDLLYRGIELTMPPAP